MKIQYSKTAEEMAELADNWLKQQARDFQAKSLYLPAGETPKPLYERWRKDLPEYLKTLELMQIDEVISERRPQLFEHFFQAQLGPLQLKVVSPSKSQGSQADLAILGLGKNGHLAFHEPHVSKDFHFGEVELAELTKQTLQLERSAKGLSYGLKAFLQTKAVLLLVSGEGKEKAFEEFVNREVDSIAAELHRHSELSVIAMGSFKDKTKANASGGSRICL